MAGVHDTEVIDLVTHDAETGEYALIMIEERAWGNSKLQIDQLREKINNYAFFALDEGLIRTFPGAADKPIRLQIDCIEPPTGEAAILITRATELLREHGIGFRVHVLD